MKTLLSLLTITTLSTSLVSNVNGFLNNKNNNTINTLNTTTGTPTVSKITNLDLDFSNIVTLNNTVWASSRDHGPYSKSGLYKSTDNTNFIKNPVIGEMTSMVSTKNGTLYLADDDILYNSTDNGATFNRMNPFKGGIECIGITSNDTIYVGSRNILYQSTDGVNFNKVYDFGSSFISKIVIAPNNTMYLIVGDGLNNYATKSFDAGYHFMQIPNITFVNDIAITQDNTVYIAGISLYKSTDNGNNFTEVPKSKEISIFGLSVTQNNVVYFATPSAVWQLNSDNTFSKIWGFTDMINTISYAPDGIIWVGTDHGLFKLWFA